MCGRVWAVAAAVGGASGLASGAIVTATAATVQVITAPTVADQNLTGAGFRAVAWNERTNVSVSGLAVDMLPPGHSATALGGFYSGVVNSHILHFSTTVSGTGPGHVGTVKFDAPIVALLYTQSRLAGTDGIFGAVGTTYGANNWNRGLNISLPTFSFAQVLGVLPDTLFFQLLPGGWSVGGAAGNFLFGVDQIRVLTRPVPSVGGLAVFGVGAACGLRRKR